MAGPLFDLVATGANDQALIHGNRASRDLREVTFPGNRPTFGQPYRIHMERRGDILNAVALHVKVNPTLRWKPHWIYSFVKKYRLRIAGQVICETNTQQLWMEHHIHGKRYLEQDGEILFEPLKFQDIFLDEKRIPLVAIQFSEVTIEMETGDLSDCVDEIVQNPLEFCTFSCEYLYLDDVERRDVAREPHRIPVRSNDYCERTFDRPEELTIRLDQIQVCSAAYLWITDENNQEIPRALENLRVRLNHQTRWDITALQSQQQMRALLPHSTQETPTTQNLYYLSYFSGRREPTGIEQGLNLSRIDMYQWILRFRENAPQRVKLHVIHRTQNQFRTLNGLMALVFATETPRLLERHEPVAEAQWGPLAGDPLPVFTNTDQEIPVEDEPFCMITYAEFENGQQVDQCMQCRKMFQTEALQRWLNGKASKQQTCIHCSLPYNPTNFRRGRISVPQNE